ncbi:MAG: rhodanese-like domain-containing protein [Sphingobacteriales bacterium]|nr:MAG: rhodanese-like domain-containing protein [Sphingobacteriales bacterium]
MKKAFILSVAFLFFILNGSAQNPVNWTKEQLLEPATLAAMLQSKKDLPALISVGPGATIPHSIHIGPANDANNLSSLETKLKAMPKSAPVVIYCGCCPFENCPNVRPAIAMLKDQKFTNYKLLNIPRNLLRTDGGMEVPARVASASFVNELELSAGFARASLCLFGGDGDLA